jgi:hypothetical protein
MEDALKHSTVYPEMAEFINELPFDCMQAWK